MKRPLKNSKIAFEEILVDRHAKSFSDDFQRLEAPLSEVNILKFFVFTFVCILILFGRVFYLNIIKGNENYLNSENNRMRYILIKAPRGVIYDRYHNAIVSNKTSLSLIVLPRDFLDNKAKITDLKISQKKTSKQLQIQFIPE